MANPAVSTGGASASAAALFYTFCNGHDDSRYAYHKCKAQNFHELLPGFFTVKRTAALRILKSQDNSPYCFISFQILPLQLFQHSETSFFRASNASSGSLS